MLPPLNGMPQDQEGEIRHTNARRTGIFDNLSNSIATSPKFMAQESLVKTLGNNFVTQGIMQAGGVLGGILDKITANDDQIIPENEGRGPGLSAIDRNILKEMLKTLLRIEDNTSSGGFGISQESQEKLESGKTESAISGRLSAEDIIERINKKNPMQPLSRDARGNLIQEHFSDIGQSVANTAATGVYEAFGYNILTQGAMDTLGLAGDVSSKLLDKFGRDASNDQSMAAADGSPVERETLAETKESKGILGSMLDRLTEISTYFKKYFETQEGLTSEIEKEFEETKIGAKPPAPALPKELVDKLRANQATDPTAPSPVASEPSLLQKAGDVAEVIHTARGILPGGKKALGKLGRLASHIKLPSMGALAPIAMGAAPLAAMAYAANKAGDQTHDIENVESLKETSSGISGFFKSIGLDFSGKFDKAREKSREGLDTTAELEALKKTSSVDNLEKKVEEVKAKEAKQNRLFGDGIKQDIANITNINSQTVIPTRYTVRQTDAAANRYFDKALK